jgi:predicted dithiol-disulfide oxidoreductase (DUF899 family)
MLGPGWKAGCSSCSFVADHFDGSPYTWPIAFHGGGFAFGSDFNFDYQVSYTPEEKSAGKVYYNYAADKFENEEAAGTSVFAKDAIPPMRGDWIF